MPCTELPNPIEAGDENGHDSAGILSAVLGVYREQGFERGYERALQDLLASLVPVTEQHLRQQGHPSGEARRLVYGYIEFLENYIRRVSEEAGYVSEGLGI